MLTRNSHACNPEWEPLDLINLNSVRIQLVSGDVDVDLTVLSGCVCVSRGELAEDFTDPLGVQGRSKETNPAQTFQVPFSHPFSVATSLILQ